MLFALSTGHKIGLATTGAVFITFSLLSSFVFPRLWPGFPGRKGLRWYIPLCFCFFFAMMAAVFVFGKESKESTAATTTSASTPRRRRAAGS